MEELMKELLEEELEIIAKKAGDILESPRRIVTFDSRREWSKVFELIGRDREVMGGGV